MNKTLLFKVLVIVAAIAALFGLYKKVDKTLFSVINHARLSTDEVTEVKQEDVKVAKQKIQKQKHKSRPIPPGFLRYENAKFDMSFLYPKDTHELCFSDDDCLPKGDDVSYIKVVPTSTQDTLHSYFFKMTPIGLSEGVEAAHFANVIHRVNENNKYLIAGSEQTISMREGLGYSFDTNGNFAWNGYLTDGTIIQLNKTAPQDSKISNTKKAPLRVLYFSQNNYLFEVIFDRDSQIANDIVSSILFERRF